MKKNRVVVFILIMLAVVVIHSGVVFFCSFVFTFNVVLSIWGMTLVTGLILFLRSKTGHFGCAVMCGCVVSVGVSIFLMAFIAAAHS